ncbi:MAG: ABC transporter permease [Verrucomicrobia bacterium]|nr:ABC transporter permease [Cytophagales bacterium]
MLLNSLKIALRGYLRNRLFTLLNLLSLVIGLFVAYVAIGYISYEYSYDKFHKNAANIYRLGATFRSQDYSIVGFESGNENSADVQVRQIEKIKTITGIKNATQFVTSSNLEFVTFGNKQIKQGNLLITNTPKSFVNIFSWKLRLGSFEDFSSGSNKVLLTVSTAKKLLGNKVFNDPSVLQQTIKIGSENYALAGIIEDVPSNSHFNFEIAVNKPRIDYWGSRIYVQLDANAKPEVVEKKITSSVGFINPTTAKSPDYKRHFLQTISAIHLQSGILYEPKPTGNRNYIFIIGFFALFIIIITVFNYTNLTLAIKSREGKNMGIKKVIGASDISIAAQFMIEGVLLALVALLVVGLFINLLIPYFNTLMGVALNVRIWEEYRLLFLLSLLAVFIGLAASMIPALYLSWKNVLVLFKENLKANRFQFFSVRKYLLVSQFVILISITCTSYFISKQVDFIENKALGFQKDGIIYAYSSEKNQDLFQQKLRQVSEIQFVGNGSTFGIRPFNEMTYKLPGKSEVFDDASQLYLDTEALKAYQLKTTLNTKLPAPNGQLIINRTAAEKLAKFQKTSVDKLIGTTIITEPEYTDENGRQGIPFTIAGIFEDIHLFSLHEKIESYFIMVTKNARMDGRSIIAFKPENTAKVLQSIQSIYKELNEPFPLEYTFLNENIKNLHEQDRRTASLVFYFNLIAIILATLGIVGITIFLMVARTKEIGIRKVLGASAFSIVKSTFREYLFFIGLAFVLSCPVAYYITDSWLSNFAYHIDIQGFVFLLVGLFTFLFTFLIVGSIAYKAALANPVTSLRTE